MSASPSASWSDIAPWYHELVEAGSGPHQLATETTLTLLPAATGLRVLDVACRQGLATRAIAIHDPTATVVGTDSNLELVTFARAREQEDPRSIDYVVDDAQVLEMFADRSVDLVTCQLGLMDIPDLDATLTAVHRVLQPGGSFVFVIGHPCFLAPDATTLTDGDGRTGRFVSDYFDERFWRSGNANGVRRVGNHHRTVATYLNALTASGFHLDVVTEPQARGPFGDERPEYVNVPMFLAARTRRR